MASFLQLYWNNIIENENKVKALEPINNFFIINYLFAYSFKMQLSAFLFLYELNYEML